MWVANSLDGTVTRVDPATVAVTETIPVGPGPAAVAATGETVWISVEFGNRLVRVDPTGSEAKIASTVEIGNRPKGLAVDRDGIWVAVQAAGAGHRGGRLVVLAPGLNVLDPASGSSNVDGIAQGLVFDGLTALRRSGGAEGTQLVPDLAETLPTATNGGRTWTFRLRKGIHYSDGRVVQPADFRRGLERLIAGGVAGTATSPPDQWKVVGAAGCTARRCDLARGVTTGANSVTFRLTQPNPRLPLMLVGVAPAPPGTPIRGGGRPVPGTGPYLAEGYARGRGARFVRNPHFRVWSPAARPDGYPDEIVWRQQNSEDKGVAMLLDGAADVVPQSSPQKRLAELKTRYASLLHAVPQKATTFLFLNTRQPPFDDVRVRQAINLAIDRSRVASLAGGSELASPTCQYLPPSLPGFAGYCPYTASPDESGAWKAPDLERAKRLIAASGTHGAEVEVWTFPYFAKEARYTVSLLRRLGYRAHLKQVQKQDDYFRDITTTHRQAGFAGWFNTQLPSDVFGTLACNTPYNWGDFCDRSFDRRVRRLRRTEVSEPEAAAKLAAKLDREAVDKAPWVALFTPQLVDVVSARVGNYQSNPYNGILLDQLWVR